MTTPITYFARLTCRDCPATAEIPALASLEYERGRDVAVLDCDAYSAGWHDCGEYVLCGKCWEGVFAG